ncbi:Ig-like domain-containing protein [Acidobacteriota bacterium]
MGRSSEEIGATGWIGSVLLTMLLAGSFLMIPSCKAPPVSHALPLGSVLSLSADPLRIAVTNGVSTITVAAFDDQGYPVPDESEVFLTTSLGIVTPRLSTVNGVAQGNLQSDGNPGIATVTAFGGGANTMTIDIAIGDSPGQIAIAANPPSLSGNRQTSEILVTIFGQDGARMPGVPVVFSTTAGWLDSGGQPKNTNQSGEAGDVLHTTNTATVTATSSTASAGVTVEVTTDPSDALTLVADPPALASPGDTATLTATVTSDGNPMSGVPVVFQTTAGTLSKTSAVKTNSNGIAVNTLTTSEAATVTATGGGLSGSVTVLVEGLPATITLTATPDTLPPGGNPDPPGTLDPVELRAVVKDSKGFAVQDAPVDFYVEGPGELQILTAIMTNADGEAKNWMRTDRTTTVRIRTLPRTLTTTVDIEVQGDIRLDLLASRSDITDLSEIIQVDLCEGGVHTQLPVFIQVSATDIYGDAVAGLPVEVYVDATGSHQRFGKICAPANGVTNAVGSFTARFVMDGSDRILCDQLSKSANLDPTDPNVCQVQIHARSGTITENNPVTITAVCTDLAVDCIP